MQEPARQAMPMADAVFVVDGDGRIVEWDENVAALIGWNAAEMLGSNLVDLLPEWRAHAVLRARLVADTSRLPAVYGAEPRHLWLGRRTGSATEIEMRIVPAVLVPDNYLVLLRVLDADAAPGPASSSSVRRLEATCPPARQSTWDGHP